MFHLLQSYVSEVKKLAAGPTKTVTTCFFRGNGGEVEEEERGKANHFPC